jgi:DNA-binding transcriptional LysR family regulator
MELRQIRYVLAVAKEGSFTRAAQRLNVSQSAISEQVKLLEGRLGFPLLVRTGRGAEMTEKGRVFLHEAERIATDIMHLEEIGQNLRAVAKDKINIGMISGLANVLVDWRQRKCRRTMQSGNRQQNNAKQLFNGFETCAILRRRETMVIPARFWPAG